MRKFATCVLALVVVLSLPACSSNVVHDAEGSAYAMFERHRIDGYYSILVEKDTGVCYLEHEGKDISTYGITVMLNPDGTPKIWRNENE